MTLGPFGILLLLGLPLWTGTGAARALGLPRSGGAWWAWAWVAGAMVTGAVVFLSLWAGGRPDGDLLAIVLAALGCLFHKIGAGRTPSQESAAPAAPAWERWLYGAVVAGTLVLTVDRAVIATAHPVVVGDEAHIWAAKAKVLWHESGFGSGYEATLSEDKPYIGHPDYPLLNPLLQVWTFARANGLTHVENRLPIQAFAVALLLLVASVLRRLLRPSAAALLLLVHHHLLWTRLSTESGFADLMVALGLAMTLDAWRRLVESPAPWKWRLLGLSAAFLAWSKHEGTMLLVLVAVAGGAAAWRSGGPRPRQSDLPWLCLPAAVIGLTWAVNAVFGAANNMVGISDASGTPLLLAQFSDRLGPVVAYMRDQVLLHPGHTNLIPAAALGLAVAFPIRLLGRAATLVPLLVCFGALTAYALVFVGSPSPLDWHLDTACARVAYHVLPALLLWLGLAAGRVLPWATADE